MKTKTVLDYISSTGCSVKTEKYVEDGGKEYLIGEPARVAYMNSVLGRNRLEKDYPDYYNALVMTVWGETPNVIEEDE